MTWPRLQVSTRVYKGSSSPSRRTHFRKIWFCAHDKCLHIHHHFSSRPLIMTFPHFLRLPLEIQNMVWTEATHLVKGVLRWDQIHCVVLDQLPSTSNEYLHLECVREPIPPSQCHYTRDRPNCSHGGKNCDGDRESCSDPRLCYEHSRVCDHTQCYYACHRYTTWSARFHAVSKAARRAIGPLSEISISNL